jgi:chemotaxis protein CheZ
VTPTEPVEDAAELRQQIESLSDDILMTLTEVATIRHPMMDDDRVLAAVDELDAIVTATEVATDRVLTATERLDDLAHKLRTGETDASGGSAVIAEATTAIYEASNFQDVTGQRIAKVMALLRDVDLRVMAMIRHLGGEEKLFEVPPPQGREGEAALVNGPQRAETALAQDAIDGLFD